MIRKLIAVLIIAISLGFSNCVETVLGQSTLLPKKLAVYYAWPSVVNGSAGNVNAATEVFNDYDLVVFGNGLQESSHEDHANTVAIINNLSTGGNNTEVYGYVTIGVTGSNSPNLTQMQIEDDVDAWRAMGVVGIFLDEAGYDFGVSRERQNDAVDYIHNQGLNVFINAWNPDHVFSSTIDAVYNPSGAPTLLGPNDIYLLESFQIIESSYDDPLFWANKSDKALAYRDQVGTRMATVTTVSDAVPAFDQAKFDYAWWSTLLYSFDYMGWGEAGFSAANAMLPYRPRVAPGNIGNAFATSSVTHTGNLHTRTTTAGTIEINTNTHIGRFLSTSLISYWKFDDGTGTTAQDSYDGNSGTLVNGLNNSSGPIWTTGIVGGALRLDGIDDYVDIGDKANLNLGTDDFTIEAWIKTEQTNGTFGVIAGKYNAQPLYYIRINTIGHLQSRIDDGVLSFEDSDGSAINDGDWHHVAAVFDRDGNMTRYVDGTLYGTPMNISGISASNIDNFNPFRIGAGGGTATLTQLFDGTIDEVAIYRRALTPDEIQQRYQRGYAGITPTGTGIVIQPVDATTETSPVSLTFAEILENGSGVTTLTTSSSASPPPLGLQLGNPPVYYELNTTSNFVPPIKVCIDYSQITFTGSETDLKLFHFEDTDMDGTPDSWVNRTVSIDAVNNIVCAEVNSLSPFAIFEPGALTGEDAIQNLIDYVTSLVAVGLLNHGQGNSLIAKLENALQKLNQGKINAAVNNLQAFINQVNAFINGSVLSSQEGQSLIDSATAIIIQLNGAGSAKRGGLEEFPASSLPQAYSLEQNYPNAFNPSTTIEFSIAKPGHVTLSIFNIRGQKVATLVSEHLAAGKYRYEWNASALTSGMYFYKIVTGEYSSVRKALLLK